MSWTKSSVVRSRPWRRVGAALTLLAVAAAAGLAGCGQKGPLKLPAPPAPASGPAR